MYKCTECGLEFETKPEYCDCGNDEFILSVKEPEIEEASKVVLESVEPIEPPNSAEYEFKESNLNDIIKTERESYRLPFHPAALAVFIFCIFCSLLIIFAWNPAKEEQIKAIEEQVEIKQIPPIDMLWKISSNNVVQPVNTTQVQTQNIQKNVNTTLKKVTPKIVTNAVKPQNKEIITTPKQAVQTTQVKSTVVNDAEKKAQEAKQKAEAEAFAAAEKAKKAAMSKQELANYKINLRNAIGQKIDFTKVIGDGECIISFKLDSTGKLINRNFAKQSENITLNNEVYKAVMSTPAYNSPPSGYKNEILKLYIRFINGNFAITLE